MSPRRWIFAALCLAQLAVPAWMIATAERDIREGRLWRFRTAGLDPEDLVRGRYVALRFAASQAPALGEGGLDPGDTVYALLGRDSEGFARIVRVTRKRPPGDAYFETTVRAQEGRRVRVVFPIERFYLPEQKALAAEEAVRRAGADAWAAVRIHEGRVRLENVWVGDQPLLEALD